MNLDNLPDNVRVVYHNPLHTRFSFTILHACGHWEPTYAPVHLNPVFAERARTEECLTCLNKREAPANG